MEQATASDGKQRSLKMLNKKCHTIEQVQKEKEKTRNSASTTYVEMEAKANDVITVEGRKVANVGRRTFVRALQGSLRAAGGGVCHRQLHLKSRARTERTPHTQSDTSLAQQPNPVALTHMYIHIHTYTHNTSPPPHYHTLYCLLLRFASCDMLAMQIEFKVILKSEFAVVAP